MFKKAVVLLSLFTFIEQISVSVFAQTKKTTTTKKTASSSAKRAATSSKRSASASRTSSKRSLGTASRSLSRTTSSSSSSSTTAENCISKFTECMDAQIDDAIAKYQYLADDSAVQAMQETGEPFRCIYYNSSKVEGLFANDKKYCNSDLIDSRKETYIDSKGISKKDENFNNMNVCSNQKDVNELYLSYNYYCDLSTSDVGVAGIPVNKCNLKVTDGKSKNDIFATKDSYAYYNEANKRVSNGELKIINFEKTKLFKNKIEPLGLENWNQMSLTGKTCTYKSGDNIGQVCIEGSDNCQCSNESSVSDLLEDLGLTSDENELFSINVVPPVGAGNFDAAGQYDKARNICLGNTTFKLAGSKATENEKIVQSAISYLSNNCSDTNTRQELERYYIAGTTIKPCADGYVYNSASDTCINPDDALDTMTPYSVEDYQSGEAELEQTDFLSAKKSCDLYEQTLISTRNKAYADFDTQLKNYIDDEVAKLIKNKSKSLTTIANSLSSLQQTDAQISIDNMERKAEITTSKAEAEISILNAETNLISKKVETASKTIAAQKELKTLISNNFSKQISNACMDELNTIISSSKDLAADVASLSVKSNAKGEIKCQHCGGTSNVSSKDYAALNSSEYQEFYCGELEGFNVSQIISEKVTFGECTFMSGLSSSGTLPRGIYKIILKGAGGGGGGKSVTVTSNGKGGSGGNGAKVEDVVLLSKAENYTLSVGVGGSGGGTSSLGKKAGSGKDGGATVFTVMGKKYTADGGKGGEGGGGGSGSRYRNGSSGAKAGNGEGGSGGKGGSSSYEGGSKGGDGSMEIQCVVNNN